MDQYLLPTHKEPQLWEYYKKAVASFWTVEEIDFVGDRSDWEQRLNEKERHLLLMILAFFATADGVVGENVVLNFYRQTPFMEAKYFYGFQIMMENIHAETYTLMIETYVRDAKKREELFHASENVPCVKKKIEWSLHYMQQSVPHTLSSPSSNLATWTKEDLSRRLLLERLVAFACVEGIFFSGSFCAIFWMKKRGLLPGLSFSNELISRDEGLHCDFACCLFQKLCQKWNLSLDETYITQVIRDAVVIEEQFIQECLPVELIGMNSKLMIQYIQFVSQRLYHQLVPSPTTIRHLYDPPVINPFEWMDLISLQGKTNFFEKRVAEYAKARVGLSSTTDYSFSLQEDF